MTTITVHPDPSAPRQVAAQYTRIVRAARLRPAPALASRVPYRHSALFLEPVYQDGQSYTDDGYEDDEPASITP